MAGTGASVDRANEEGVDGSVRCGTIFFMLPAPADATWWEVGFILERVAGLVELLACCALEGTAGPGGGVRIRVAEGCLLRGFSLQLLGRDRATLRACLKKTSVGRENDSSTAQVYGMVFHWISSTNQTTRLVLKLPSAVRTPTERGALFWE